MSSVRSVIPDPVRRQFREWWLALKGIETEHLGDDEITEKMEMAGWGVREAHEQNLEEASTFTLLRISIPCRIC